MEIRIVATLAKVAIEGNEIPLVDARLTKIPFDEILKFENKQNSGVYNKLHFKYKNNPPVFFEKWITVPDKIFKNDNRTIILELNKYSKAYIDVCILALHFSTNSALLHPRLSTIYYDYRSENNFDSTPSLKKKFKTIGAYRCIGESGREYTFQNPTSDVFINEQMSHSLREEYRFLLSKSKLIENELIQFLIEPIQSLALPEINQDMQQILLAGTLESLLISDIKSGINKHFVSRFKKLCSRFQYYEDVIVENTYKLRSSIIHGDSKEKEKILKRIKFSYHEYLGKLHSYSILGIREFLKGANEDEPIEVQLSTFRQLLNNANL